MRRLNLSSLLAAPARVVGVARIVWVQNTSCVAAHPVVGVLFPHAQGCCCTLRHRRHDARRDALHHGPGCGGTSQACHPSAWASFHHAAWRHSDDAVRACLQAAAKVQPSGHIAGARTNVLAVVPCTAPWHPLPHDAGAMFAPACGFSRHFPCSHYHLGLSRASACLSPIAQHKMNGQFAQRGGFLWS